MERFDPVIERWELQSTELLCGRKYCGVAALGGAWGCLRTVCVGLPQDRAQAGGLPAKLQHGTGMGLSVRVRVRIWSWGSAGV